MIASQLSGHCDVIDCDVISRMKTERVRHGDDVQRSSFLSSFIDSLGHVKQGKSEGFESCDRLIVWKRPIWVKIGDV